MSLTCEKCGNVSEQPANFCRKCGAPAATEGLATLPLSAASVQATQEIQQLGTDALKTNSPTRPMANAKAAESDPLDTWEPAKAVGSPAATEVLSSGTVSVPVKQANGTNAVQSTATGSPAKSNTGILIAAAAALLVFAFGGWLWLQRSSTPAATEVAPIASTTPAEVSNLASPVAEASPIAIVESVLNQNAATAKPSASVKPGSKTNMNATLSPQSNADERPSAAAPVPVKTEPEPAAPAENPASLVEQGNRLASAGQLPQAIQMYEKARIANPGNADIYYLLGSAYHRSGDLANALAAYRKCTAGNYASVAANHVKNLEKKLSKVK